ncbi:MAG: glycine cleavage system aminomethyltransferase GcvT [Fimbriimonas sp.]
MADALTTPLYDAHVAAGGRMVPFAGYLMPVQYASVIAEAKAVREGAGMFDVSHMARLTFRGGGVFEFLEGMTSNDISKLKDGTGQYSLLPNVTGGVVDDIIVYRIHDREFRMVVNAANHRKDVLWLQAYLGRDVDLQDETVQSAMIAVQGPKAVEIIAGLSENPDAYRNAPIFGVVSGRLGGIQCSACRSGYTGEDGYELICHDTQAVALWNLLLEAGVAPCGLGARDVLRVEAGLPLYGHELTDDLSPIAAGLGWVVSKTKAFLGSDLINLARAKGTATKLVGIQLGSKRLTAPGMEVFVDDQKVGEVSSGVYSPLLECGIAFAFVHANIELGTACELDIRGKREPATAVNKRFFRRKA